MKFCTLLFKAARKLLSEVYYTIRSNNFPLNKQNGFYKNERNIRKINKCVLISQNYSALPVSISFQCTMCHSKR